MKTKMLVYTPFTGLGLYGGFRGNRWLRNRIKVFKQFVIPSLIHQTDQEWVHWISWREEERGNKYVTELSDYLTSIPNYRFVFTYHGICFWDDKYDQTTARKRLYMSLKNSTPELLDVVPDCDNVQILLQPSDDLYEYRTIEAIKKGFIDHPDMQALGFTKGYLINYSTKEVLEYNPKTNPPFFAYQIPRNLFADPGKHMTYISTKQDEGQYPKGTPYPSHEWIPNAFKMAFLKGRGFMVGTHGENISTHFNHPYGGAKFDPIDTVEIQKEFGISDVAPITLPFSLRRWIMRKLPYRAQRKLRYIFGEVIYQRFYNFLRN